MIGDLKTTKEHKPQAYATTSAVIGGAFGIAATIFLLKVDYTTEDIKMRQDIKQLEHVTQYHIPEQRRVPDIYIPQDSMREDTLRQQISDLEERVSAIERNDYQVMEPCITKNGSRTAVVTPCG